MKKILLFLVLLLNAAATFAKTFTKDGVTYTYSGTTASVTSTASGLAHITILESITPSDGITYSVTSIGDYAFSGSDLTSVTIPSSVTSIGTEAFQGSGLTSVTIPSSVTSIGAGAFAKCADLTSIDVESGNQNFSSKDGVLFSKDEKTIVCYPAGYTGNSYAIPSTVTSIGEAAFSGCTKLTSITIPPSVTSIGVGAFGGSVFMSVTIPSSVSSIGAYAFSSSQLSSIIFAEGSKLTSIEPNTFEQCQYLASITIPSSVTSIGEYAFADCSGLKSAPFAEGAELNDIGSYAFSGCSGLTSVTIPSSVTSIMEGAFRGCSALATVYLPKKTAAAELGESAFDKTSSDIKFCVEDGTGTYDLTIYTGATNWTSYASKIFYYCPKTISPAGIGTLYLPYEVTIPTGVTAYKFDATDNKTYVTLKQIPEETTTISAGTPVYLTATAGTTYNFYATSNDINETNNNGFVKGTKEDIAYVADTYLTLGQITGGTTYGFYMYSNSESPIKANTCYIKKADIPATAKGFTLSFDGGTTAIDAATATAEPAMKVYYDLQGRRVLNPTKGLYIVNGKKVVINQ